VRKRLTVATLHSLTNVENGSDRKEQGRFALDHFQHLTRQPEQIEQLREMILSLAVHGRLVIQDSREESAAITHRRHITESEDYAKHNRISLLILDPVSDRDKPFAPLQGWIWVRLASLCKYVTDGDHLPPPKAEKGVAFLTIGNVTTGQLNFSNCRFVSHDYFDSIAPCRRPEKGDILYTVVGATYGRPALVETERPFCVQRHIAILKPCSGVEVAFLRILMASPFVYDQATNSLTGTAQPTIPLRSLRNLLIPLPPLREQQRIVAKVDKLMSLCSELEGLLTTNQLASQRLLESTLHEALSSYA